MNLIKFKELWNWLEENTNNFTPRKDSFNNIINCVIRQYNYYNCESGCGNHNDIIAFLSALNIYQNHYLINGNKRIAFGVMNLIKTNEWEHCKDILKLLENE